MKCSKKNKLFSFDMQVEIHFDNRFQDKTFVKKKKKMTQLLETYL